MRPAKCGIIHVASGCSAVADQSCFSVFILLPELRTGGAVKTGIKGAGARRTFRAPCWPLTIKRSNDPPLVVGGSSH